MRVEVYLPARPHKNLTPLENQYTAVAQWSDKKIQKADDLFSGFLLSAMQAWWRTPLNTWEAKEASQPVCMKTKRSTIGTTPICVYVKIQLLSFATVAGILLPH